MFNIQSFMNDDWLSFFGEIMVIWPLKPVATFDKDWITRLVLFENEVRIDFQITSKLSIDSSVCEGYHKFLVDKDGLAKELNQAHSHGFVIKRPTMEEYYSLVNSFFWDATYVAKTLYRDELCYAKYMLDNILRFNCLQPMIEWYIAMQHGWSVNTGKCGRHFKSYLDAKTWTELEATFSDADIGNNWRAFFNMISLFRRLAREVARNEQYNYPEGTDRKVAEYCLKIQATEKNIAN